MDELRLEHLIDGEWVMGDGHTARHNPSDLNELIAWRPEGGTREFDAAVSAARRAFAAWSSASPEFRADCLDRIASAILANADALGRLLSREEGKTFPEGKGEVMRAGRIFRYFAGEAIRRHGQTLDSVRPGVDVTTRREAVGVFGMITPWNFPIAIPAWKAAPALAFGNTVVLKPAPDTPAIAAALGRIIVEAGVPAGVFNLVFGGAAVGAAMANHPDIDGISFTGSQSTGQKIAEAVVRRQGRLQMEMGGKNPLVVLDDADLERAVRVALDGAYFGTGQRCTASSRLIVQDAIHDRFVAALAERVTALKVGHALDASTQIGPVVNERQVEVVYGYIEGAKAHGARVAAGGRRMQIAPRGWHVEPTLFADTDPDMTINREEVFGPVASIVRAPDYEAALNLANAGEFGLSAGIVTTSLKHAEHFRRAVRAGMVMINLPTAGVDYHVPFGGARKSSHGPREQGYAAVEFYTQIKTIYSDA